MDGVMVIARDLQGDEPLKLAQSQARMFSRIVFPQLARIALGRPRQEVDRAYLGSDQPLDMSAEMGRAWRTPNNVDSLVSTRGQTPCYESRRHCRRDDIRVARRQANRCRFLVLEATLLCRKRRAGDIS